MASGMARKKLIQLSDHPYHITARANNQNYFGVPPKLLWQIFNDYLFFISNAFGVRAHAFVMMANHFHLIASFPEKNVSQAMNRFMTETARVINHVQGSINHIYGSRYHACLINDFRYYAFAYRYVFQNPVRAGLCQSVEEYQYSTLSGLLGQQPIQIPIFEFSSPYVPKLEDHEDLLRFLNFKAAPRTIEATRKALYRTQFHFSGKYLAWTRTHAEPLLSHHTRCNAP